jgi:hypothetical protein
MNNIKEINGKYYQECKVILLPTESGSNISMDAYGKMYFGNYPENTPFNQHLYITSNEEIKKSDWYYNERRKTVEQGNFMINTCELIFCKKIIATTDTSLGLPQPSKSFIQAYIKAYNENKPITKVLVEMESAFNIPTIYDYKQIKVNSSNEITIKKIKDSYTREEVINKCLKMQYEYPKFVKESYYTPNTREIADWTNDWIEENL